MRALIILGLIGLPCCFAASANAEGARERAPAGKQTLLTSPWSEVSNGLRTRVKASPSATRLSERGLISINVTCEIQNMGETATSVVHLSRILLRDSDGNVIECQRIEDVEDSVPSRASLLPGASTRWEQDGLAKIPPGTYGLSVRWDTDKQLISPPVDIRVRKNR